MKKLNDEEYTITSLSKFFEIIDKRYSATTVNRVKWIYRGQDDYEYKLIPCVGRLFGKENFKTLEQLRFYEKNSLSQFELLTYDRMREVNQFVLLAVAQHHGMKTRLLDWTFSAIVALFFAVENQSMHNVDGAFFAYNTNKSFTNILRRNESPFDDLGAAYQYLSIPSLTPRINAQSGIFQLFRDPTIPLEESDWLEKLIIPSKHKRDLKIELYDIGISYSSLFPDLDGIAKHINYLYLNEDN